MLPLGLFLIRIKMQASSAFHDEASGGVIIISDGFLEYLILSSIDLHLNCC